MSSGKPYCGTSTKIPKGRKPGSLQQCKKMGQVRQQLMKAIHTQNPLMMKIGKNLVLLLQN